MKLCVLATLFTIPAAFAGEPEGRKPENQPYIGLEAGNGYHELYMAQPFAKRWQIHGLVYRTEREETGFEPVGFIGPSCRLFQLKGLETSLGGGLYAGRHQPVGAALLGEAVYEAKWLKGEGVLVQALRRPQENGRRDKYLVWYFGPQFPCWSNSTCEAGYGQDTIGYNRESETLRGARLAAPIPRLPHTKAYLKIFTHGTLLWGLEFRP